MSYYSHGHIKVSRKDPHAAAQCDRCGFYYNHTALRWQYEWRGDSVKNIYWLVCKRCLDNPQPQLKTRRIPPDPVPIKNPRPDDSASTVFGTLGFTQYSLIGSASDPTSMLTALEAQLAPAPPNAAVFTKGTIASNQASQALVGKNLARTYLLVMNPGMGELAISLGSASVGSVTSLDIGPLGAILWATSQGIAVTTAALTISGNVKRAPFYLYEG